MNFCFNTPVTVQDLRDERTRRSPDLSANYNVLARNEDGGEDGEDRWLVYK